MAWNEPGGGNRDPWSGPGKNNQGPPDLDEVLRKLQGRLHRLFGGKSGGDSGDEAGGGGGAGAFGLMLLAGILLLAWLASGFYIVDQGWRGVVLRFGEHVDTAMPGPHWVLPYPISEVRRVNVTEVRVVEVGYQSTGGGRKRPVLDEALMLTRDENIVNVQLAVQYRVEDPAAYLFQMRDPDGVLKRLAKSALREVVGKRPMEEVLTWGSVEEITSEGEMAPRQIGGSAEVAASARELIEQGLAEEYGSGLRLVDVAVQDIQPPDQVQEAFADAVGAREDRQRLINQAHAYANEIIPRAQGEAARATEEAEAYRARVVAEAQGEGSRFVDLLSEYQQAPEVTRERLYLAAMEQVLSRSSKILVGVEGGQPLMYLPLDKMMERSARPAGAANTDSGGGSAFVDDGLGGSSFSGGGASSSTGGRNVERRRGVR
ncbi:FtsH protease activity modulator HflK [Alkalilimnicola sp. S0819]|uniref:FtsH protease activity modulator HflK n=1 Tax=Alkalilimnicola sp. S0819 TaxID=2613922 RepID=UPI0012614EEC|nr:FtsH protease activity modulator HflK [Alkalilimnicola sp. S0819]KAB7628355.1 FtsH protease activity modulator HflK [Alkalilimnicola sp. S0819]MPQ15256.1 FtsH protease activity modulator HflK [Alkalilimnicola sp. S0819]